MKNNILNRFLTLSYALVLLAFASKTFASSDYLLEIKDEKGKTHKISVKPDGTFTTPAMKAGVYSFSFGASNPGTYSSGGGSGTGKMASKEDVYVWKVSKMSITCDIKAPRDAQSGMATGKRMHKPFTITKEWGASSPQLAKSSPLDGKTDLGSITVDEDCDGLAGMIVCTSSDGKKMAMDDWSAPVK